MKIDSLVNLIERRKAICRYSKAAPVKPAEPMSFEPTTTHLETIILSALEVRPRIQYVDLLHGVQRLTLASNDTCMKTVDRLVTAGKVRMGGGYVMHIGMHEPLTYLLPKTVRAIRLTRRHLQHGVNMPGVTRDEDTFYLQGEPIPFGHWVIQFDNNLIRAVNPEVAAYFLTLEDVG